MTFAPILLEITNITDREVILEYLKRQKTYLGINDCIHNMHFAIRRSNGLTFDRIDIYVNNHGLILPISVEKNFTHTHTK